MLIFQGLEITFTLILKMRQQTLTREESLGKIVKITFPYVRCVFHSHCRIHKLYEKYISRLIYAVLGNMHYLELQHFFSRPYANSRTFQDYMNPELCDIQELASDFPLSNGSSNLCLLKDLWVGIFFAVAALTLKEHFPLY